MTAFNLRFLAHTGSPAGQIFFLLTCGTAILLAITAFYVFPVIAAFKGTWSMFRPYLEQEVQEVADHG